mmetsp:Transcript_21656/g.20782  ORF Transcript_21656/g.20782 Transcript_21656/m.20782 type:complete len:84 (-) Transcript_21656:775-1026(-)
MWRYLEVHKRKADRYASVKDIMDTYVYDGWGADEPEQKYIRASLNCWLFEADYAAPMSLLSAKDFYEDAIYEGSENIFPDGYR